jgi:hypothetical protein
MTEEDHYGNVLENYISEDEPVKPNVVDRIILEIAEVFCCVSNSYLPQRLAIIEFLEILRNGLTEFKADGNMEKLKMDLDNFIGRETLYARPAESLFRTLGKYFSCAPNTEHDIANIKFKMLRYTFINDSDLWEVLYSNNAYGIINKAFTLLI